MRARRGFQIILEADRATVLRAVIDDVRIAIDSGRPTRLPTAFLPACADVLRTGCD